MMQKARRWSGKVAAKQVVGSGTSQPWPAAGPVLALAVACLLWACGGGGGGGAGPSGPASLAGVWTVTERTTSTSCGDYAGRVDVYAAQIAQVGSQLSVTTPYGAFSGSATGAHATWSGQGTTSTGDSLQISGLDVAVDASWFSGAFSWEVHPSASSGPVCTGTSSISGVPGAAPPEPTGLTAEPVDGTTDSIRLTWDLAQRATEYDVQRSGPGCATPWISAGPPVAQPGFVASGLDPGTDYCFQVLARNALGTSSPSPMATARTGSPPLAPPVAPTGLAAASSSSTTVRLTWWHDDAEVDGFRIYRRTSQDSAFGPPSSVGRGVRSVEDSGLAAAQGYVYRVTAFNQAGDSSPSNDAVVTTRPAGQDLSAPTSLSVQAISGADAALAWGYAGSGQVGFHVYRASGSQALLGTVPARQRSFIAHGLRQGVIYDFLVSAYDDLGESPPSNVVSIRMPTDVAGQAWTLAYTVTSSTCGINGSMHSYADVTVFRSAEQVTVDTGYGVLSGLVQGNALSLTGPLHVASATLQIVSSALTVADDGNSVAGTCRFSIASPACTGTAHLTMSRAAPALDLPAAPAAVTATATSSGSIALTWTPTSSNAAGFRIYRGTTASALAPLSSVPGSAARYDDTGLSPATTYLYQVIAFDADGDSPPSATASATTPALAATPPVAPADLRADGSAPDAIALSWRVASDDESGFRIYRALAGGTPAQVGTAPAGATTYLDGGLSPDTAYDYRLTAWNATGEFSSATVTGRIAAASTTVPVAPFGL